jgi:hypothetical protein
LATSNATMAAAPSPEALVAAMRTLLKGSEGIRAEFVAQVGQVFARAGLPVAPEMAEHLVLALSSELPTERGHVVSLEP